jgi:hypothetical protein
MKAPSANGEVKLRVLESTLSLKKAEGFSFWGFS